MDTWVKTKQEASPILSLTATTSFPWKSTRVGHSEGCKPSLNIFPRHINLWSKGILTQMCLWIWKSLIEFSSCLISPWTLVRFQDCPALRSNLSLCCVKKNSFVPAVYPCCCALLMHGCSCVLQLGFQKPSTCRSLLVQPQHWKRKQVGLRYLVLSTENLQLCPVHLFSSSDCSVIL